MENVKGSSHTPEIIIRFMQSISDAKGDFLSKFHAYPVLLFIFLLTLNDVSANTLSLTFDDGLDPGKNVQAHQVNGQLLQMLRDHHLQAMIFPAVSKIGEDDGLNIIKAWSDAGHYVGNHSVTHQGLSTQNVTLDFFIADVCKADATFRTLRGWLPLLRFPYLQEGDTPEKRDGMRQWMRTHGYRPAPVSIETSDWQYNLRFVKLLKSDQTKKMIDLKRDYLAHLLERANFFDSLAKRVLGRSPLHVMLLHVNEINAALLPEILKTFKNKGWDFISPKTAFDDPLYSEEPNIIPAGGSIVSALAKSRDVKGF